MVRSALRVIDGPIRKRAQKSSVASCEKCAGCTMHSERIHELEAEVRRLTELTLRDALTGLYNSRGLRGEFDLLASLLRLGRIDCITLVYIDLVGFKAINDTFGHAGGDIALSNVAEVMTRALRPGDTLARLHGDEFIILLSDKDESEAAHICERLRGVLRSTRFDSFPGALLDFSYGLCLIDETNPLGLESAAKVADKKMYDSRGEGNFR